MLHLGDKGGSKIENISFLGELQDNISYVSGYQRKIVDTLEEDVTGKGKSNDLDLCGAKYGQQHSSVNKALQKHNLSHPSVRCL